MTALANLRGALSTREWWVSLLSSRRFVLVLVTFVVGVLAVIPLFFLVWDSFKDVRIGNIFDPSLTNFTLKNYRDVAEDPRAFTMLGNSFGFAFASMALAFVFGGGIAFLVERTNTPMRNVAYGLMFIPLIMPGMIKAVAWVLLLSPQMGLLNKLWFAVSGSADPIFQAYSLPSMVWVEGLSMSPLTFLMLGAALRTMDPSLEEAAYTAGSGRARVLFRITLPLMTPALAGIGLLQFVRGLETFEVPLLMGMPAGIPVFSTQIYWVVREVSPPQYGIGFIYGLTVIVLAMGGLLLYQRMMGRAGQYATVTGKGYRPRLIDIGRWRWAASGFILFFLFCAVVLPFLVLLYSSFLPFYQVPSAKALSALTLQNYQDLFSRQDIVMAMKNSAILSSTVSVGAVLMATMVSWIVVRLRTKASRLLDGLVFIPYAIPGVAMGFAFMILFLSFPNPIYGTIWILVLCYFTSFIPTATRFTHAGVAQIKSELEEAAAVSGANLLTMVRRIVIPLMLPSLVAGALYIFLLSVRVMSAAAILFTPKTIVVATMLFQLWNQGSIPQVGTLSVLIITAGTVLTILSRKVSQRRAIVAVE